MRTKEEALDHFRHKTPTEETLPRHEAVNEIFQSTVGALWDVTPDGPGKTLALRKLSEAKMAFNSAIANKGQ